MKPSEADTPDGAGRADGWRIVASRGLRQFAYGLMGVTLALALLADGYTAVAIGALITIGLAGDFCATYLVAIYADRWGRRRTQTVLALLMALTGAACALTRFYPALALAAFFGVLGSTASETASFLPIDQAMLPHTAAPNRHTDLFARYNLVASLAGALGALAAALPDVLARAGVTHPLGYSLMFWLYAACALGVAGLVAGLSPAVEAP
ncbi:MAG TPA: hypothetical protein VF725_00930, partial [Ktedonobacterales bacterium]